MPSAHLTFRIDAYFDDLALLEGELATFGDTAGEDVEIESGISVKPLFLSLRTFRVVGGSEALGFLVTATSSIAAKALAEVVYKWFKKTKASRLRIERTEVLITRPDEVIRLVREVVEKDIQ